MALIGIDRDRIFALGWGLGAATVGVAGAMLATFYYVSPNVGANFALIAYVTVALGGFGSLIGALVAGILIGEIEALHGADRRPSLKQVGMFAHLHAGAHGPPARPVRDGCDAPADTGIARRRRRELIVGAVVLVVLAAAAAARSTTCTSRNLIIITLLFAGLCAGVEHPGRLLRADLARPCAVFRRRRLHHRRCCSRDCGVPPRLGMLARRRGGGRCSRCWSAGPASACRGHYYAIATIVVGEIGSCCS